MELPHLGKNCALTECNQLDFLPIKCDACAQIYCLSHYQYDKHRCERAHGHNDNQVPVCPLCSEPVSMGTNRNQPPDVAVSRHMDDNCKRNTATRNGKQTNSNLRACAFRACKQKDIIYLECGECKEKFCVKHRHASDHSCPGPASSWNSFRDSCSSSASSSMSMIRNKANQISKSGQAALNRLSAATHRQQSSSRTPRDLRALQAGLSEEEALAIVLSQSKTSQTSAMAQTHSEDEDLALARALHESQLEQQRARNRTTSAGKDSCVLS